MSTTLTLTPLDDRGREILDRFDANAIPAFRWNDRTGARSYWTNAQKMIDRTYGHLARDFEQEIRARLDARAARSGDVVATEGE